MKPISLDEQHQLCGGAWGFLCGATIAIGVGMTLTTGAAAVGPAMLIAEWGCTLDYVVRG
jgi:hypothetical protein